MTPVDPIDFDRPNDELANKPLLPTTLGTRDLNENTSVQVRDRVFFSARVLNAQVLQGFKNGVAAVLKGETNPAKQRLRIKDLLDSISYRPKSGKEGTIEDLSSNARLNLMLNTNVSMLRGFGQWMEGNQEGALDAFPAQELVRVAERHEPRDWEEIWSEAVETLGDSTTATDGDSGRFVAMKNDPIWIEISDFGLPYPPFKFNSGMGVEDVSYEDAVDLGVMDPDDSPIQPPNLGMNDGLQASVEGLDRELAQVLAQGLSPFVELVGGELRFANDGSPVTMEIFQESADRYLDRLFRARASGVLTALEGALS
jgi:hypothetical protein